MTERELVGRWITKDKIYSITFIARLDTFAFFEKGKNAKHVDYSLESGILIIKSSDFEVFPFHGRSLKVIYKGKQISFDKV